MDTKLIDERIEEVERVVLLHGADTTILCKNMFEWLKEIREQIVNNQKYTVQVFPGEYGYLNSASGEKFTIHSSDNTEYWRTHFTQAEINEFKNHDDLAIDWDKAIIEQVKAEN